MPKPADVPEEELLEEEDDWGTEPGFPDEFDFWIDRARFGYVPDYTRSDGKPALVLIWEGHSPQVDLERPIIFSVGEGWVPIQNGRAVKHEGGRKKFVESSMAGRLVERCIELGLKDFLKSRGMAKQAKTWEGLGFRLKREEFAYPGLGKEKVSRLMPVAFLGEKGKAAAGTPKPAAAKAEAAAERPYEEDVPETLLRKLTALARAKDYEAFVDAALNLEEIADYPKLMDYVCRAEGGFWHQVRGR